MDDPTPTTPQPITPTTPEAGEEKPVVPDPHRSEPAPASQEGMRPEADAEVVRPEADEPNGPLGGLVAAASAQVVTEATGDESSDTGAEELLAMMGVEDEGIEAGQISGIVIAMFVSIFALATAMYFLFYSPTLDKTVGMSESGVRYEELENIETEGQSKLTQYARADSAYTLPIESAMASVAAEYASSGGASAPRTRATFNTVPLETHAAGLSRQPGMTATFGADSTALVPSRYAAPVDLLEPDVRTDEEVGVDTPDRLSSE